MCTSHVIGTIHHQYCPECGHQTVDPADGDCKYAFCQLEAKISRELSEADRHADNKHLTWCSHCQSNDCYCQYIDQAHEYCHDYDQDADDFVCRDCPGMLKYCSCRNSCDEDNTSLSYALDDNHTQDIADFMSSIQPMDPYKITVPEFVPCVKCKTSIPWMQHDDCPVCDHIVEHSLQVYYDQKHQALAQELVDKHKNSSY